MSKLSKISFLATQVRENENIEEKSFIGNTLWHLWRYCDSNCPKQHNNALNVHKITHKRAKSQKIRALDGRFSTNARLDGHALYRRTTWSHSRDKGEMVLRRGWADLLKSIQLSQERTETYNSFNIINQWNIYWSTQWMNLYRLALLKKKLIPVLSLNLLPSSWIANFKLNNHWLAVIDSERGEQGPLWRGIMLQKNFSN